MANALVGKNSAFLNSFWDLASDETGKRVAAAQAIVAHVGGAATGNDDADYALKRLVRGLGSSRESARQGFVTCLTSLLVAAPAVPTATVIALIDEHTRVTGSLKGAEERDFMFGKLFGYLALARAGRLDGFPAHAAAVVRVKPLAGAVVIHSGAPTSLSRGHLLVNRWMACWNCTLAKAGCVRWPRRRS